MTIPRRTALLALAGAALLPGAALVPGTAWAASARELSSKGQAALQRLYKVQPRARELGKKAVAILVFPDIVKAGLLIGGQSGNGVLIKGGKSVAYYNSRHWPRPGSAVPARTSAWPACWAAC